jgi:hypothetical protein
MTAFLRHRVEQGRRRSGHSGSPSLIRPSPPRRQVYVDDIIVLDDDRLAISLGRGYRQKYILKVDGKARKFEFIPTGVDVK